MVIDGAKGVEERTIKLMEVCRMRDTPIISFVNKMDREIREPLELLDEIENVLNIRCVPITWPLGMGRDFAGVYNLLENKLYVYKAGFGSTITDIEVRDGYDHADIREKVGELAWASFEESLELVQMANEPLDRELFLQGKQTPVLFGTALGNFAVDHVLDAFINWAPEPKAINTGTSTKGPITVVNATGEANPNVAIATANANSKLLPAAVNEIAVVLG